MSTYRYIAQRKTHLPVRQLYQTLRVSASAYYAWQRRQLSTPEPGWQVAVRAEFNWHAARCGTRRLRAELHAKGYRVGRWRTTLSMNCLWPCMDLRYCGPATCFCNSHYPFLLLTKHWRSS